MPNLAELPGPPVGAHALPVELVAVAVDARRHLPRDGRDHRVGSAGVYQKEGKWNDKNVREASERAFRLSPV